MMLEEVKRKKRKNYKKRKKCMQQQRWDLFIFVAIHSYIGILLYYMNKSSTNKIAHSNTAVEKQHQKKVYAFFFHTQRVI